MNFTVREEPGTLSQILREGSLLNFPQLASIFRKAVKETVYLTYYALQNTPAT